MQRVRRRIISLALLMCDGDVCSILLLSLATRNLETIDVCVYVCVWRMFAFMSIVVTVWGSMGMLLCIRRC